MSTVANDALSTFLGAARAEFDRYAERLGPDALAPSAALIQTARKAGNRLHITGIGKPAHIAAYAASLISSTGTPAYFLHGTEAVHGSCGQLEAGDVVLCISNSGETAELKSTVLAVKQNGCKVIGLSGNADSWLARQSDAHILAGVGREGGPLDRAPRCSILAETLAVQALSVMLQADRALTPREYVLRHPGGALGALRDNEKREAGRHA